MKKLLPLALVVALALCLGRRPAEEVVQQSGGPTSPAAATAHVDAVAGVYGMTRAVSCTGPIATRRANMRQDG
jgi:hypothetical protein